MFESSLTERKPSLANSQFYPCIGDLLAFLQRVISDDSQSDTGRSTTASDDNQSNTGRSTTAKSVYDRLTAELSQLVIGKLETGDDMVVSRLASFLLCLTGKTSMQAGSRNTERAVRFEAESMQAGSRNTERAVRFEADPAGKADSDFIPAAGDEESLTAESGKRESLLFGADLVGNVESPLWTLISESCWISFQFIRSQSSSRHLRFLATVLCSYATDRLMTDLMTRAELSSTNDASCRRDFLERMILPLVDKFSDDDSCRYISSMLTLIFVQLGSAEQILVAREITGRAARNLICANFLSEIVSSEQSSEDMQCWLCGGEFGQFVVKLTDEVCQRRLVLTKCEEIPNKSMVNDRSMDDSHWKLLCACLRVDQKSGPLCLISGLFMIFYQLIWANFFLHGFDAVVCTSSL